MSDIALASKAALDETPELYVVFKVGETDYALPAESVLQMESFTGATRVPGAPPFVAGIVQIRGRVVPVVDMRLRFGLPAAAPTLDTRVVVGQRADRVVALIADSAREVVKLTRAQVKAPPRLLDDGASGFVRAVAHVGSRMLMVVDFAKVIGEEGVDAIQG
jgi:purine-binding chemotaxis protein CheW